MSLLTLGEVTDDELARYATLIYDVTGIQISPQKKALLSNRLRRRLKETGIESYQEYLKLLRKLPTNSPEWDAFLQEITTHETYLFRDESHWNWVQNTFLPEIISQARQGKRPHRLRVWSAASSTGDEAYTIACCIAAGLPVASQWDVTIVGTDIGVGAVEQAQRGEFGERAMRLVPENYRKRYFIHNKADKTWTVRPLLQAMTSFQQHNLLNPLAERPFDLAFLKNVLIYFDRESKQIVVDHITRMLPVGAMLVCGAAEGVSDLLGDYERVEPWLYRRK